ncbi:hypothetical protein B0H13DRAFT_1922957 [Mycena leptocephala]|nr:hypothetical protein B0H13DRAFT_1922957 [Mycena leptocephala]
MVMRNSPFKPSWHYVLTWYSIIRLPIDLLCIRIESNRSNEFLELGGTGSRVSSRRSIPSGDTDRGTSHPQAGEGSEPLNGRMVPLDPPGIWYLHAFKGAYTLLARPSAMDESIEGILDVVDRDDSGPATQPDDDGVLRQTYCYLPIPHLPPGWHILQSWSTKKLDADVPGINTANQ